jgi:hypothetical protein
MRHLKDAGAKKTDAASGVKTGEAAGETEGATRGATESE